MHANAPSEQTRREFGSLRQRGTVWYIRYRLDGREHWERGGTEAQAVKLLERRRVEHEDGRLIAPTIRRTTFEDLARIITDDYAVNGRRSAARLAQSLAQLRRVFGTYRAAHVTADRLTGYVRERTAQGAARSTIRNELNALRKAMRLARRAGRLAHVPEFPTVTPGDARRGFFEAEDLDAVLAVLPMYLRAFVRFLALTGWRAGEARGLTWAAVDFGAGILRLEAEQTKTKRPRVFPFGVLPTLNALLHEQRAMTTAVERETGRLVPWVFHRQGRQLSRHYNKTWQVAVDRAAHRGEGPAREVVHPQLVGRIVHDLRRTAVRNLVRAGVPERVCMELSGHKTRSVFDRYNIVNERDLKEGLEKLAQYAGRGTTGGQSDRRRPSRRAASGGRSIG